MADAFLPLVVGETWTYQVTDTVNSTVTTKTQSVDAYEDIGGDNAGVMGYKITTAKPSGKETVSWQTVTGDRVERLREQVYDSGGALVEEDYYDPYKLRVDGSDASKQPDDAYDETYTERVQVFPASSVSNAKTDHWVVMAVSESLTTPAGTFDCLHLRRTNAVSGSDKQYWFAAGVGKVKESAAGTIELLTDHTLP